MATNQELIDYYADLLILQYIGKPKAYATIQAQATPVIMDQLPAAVRDAFNLETAEGVQLDLLGSYAGVVRSGNLTDGTAINLTDDDFRQLIKMAITTNSSGSSLYDIQVILNTFFAGQIFVFDLANMQMNYFLNSEVGSLELVQMFVLQNLLPKPMGVQLASLIFLDIADDLFGFRTYASAGVNISPMNEYAAYELDRHWLSYADTITI